MARFVPNLNTASTIAILAGLVCVFNSLSTALAQDDEKPIPFGFQLETVSQGQSVLDAMTLANSSIDGVIRQAGMLSKNPNCKKTITSKEVTAVINLVAKYDHEAMSYEEDDKRILDPDDRAKLLSILNKIQPALKVVTIQVDLLAKEKGPCSAIHVETLVKYLIRIKSALKPVDGLLLRPAEETGKSAPAANGAPSTFRLW